MVLCSLPVKDNPVILANRSHVLLSLNKAQLALADAETVIKKWPLWPKVREIHYLFEPDLTEFYCYNS
jgi:hypothetical protein